MNENLPYEHTNVTTFQVDFIKFKCVMNECEFTTCHHTNVTTFQVDFY